MSRKSREEALKSPHIQDLTHVRNVSLKLILIKKKLVHRKIFFIVYILKEGFRKLITELCIWAQIFKKYHHFPFYHKKVAFSYDKWPVTHHLTHSSWYFPCFHALLDMFPILFWHIQLPSLSSCHIMPLCVSLRCDCLQHPDLCHLCLIIRLPPVYLVCACPSLFASFCIEGILGFSL